MVVALLVSSGSASAVVLFGDPSTIGPNGTVHIEGYPVGMAISIDGIQYGDLPVTGEGLDIGPVAVGNHTIKAQNLGNETKEIQIFVSEGQITRINVQLPEATTGILEVQSVPPQVQIFIDGTYKGITPGIITGVSAGDHTVLLKLAGYQDRSSLITLPPGGIQSISVTLEPVLSSSGQPSPVATRSSGLPSGIAVFGVTGAILGILAGRRRAP